MSSTIRNFFHRFRLGSRYVGRDLEGNKFYEYPPPQPGSTRTKRQVKYVTGKDPYAYATGLSRLPAQWTAWLSHTRPLPPTIEELHADLQRRHRVTYLAAQIQAKDEEERLQQLEAGATPSSLQVPSGIAASTSPEESEALREASPEELRAEAREKTKAEEPSGIRNPTKATDAPEPWSPNTVLRRG